MKWYHIINWPEVLRVGLGLGCLLGVLYIIIGGFVVSAHGYYAGVLPGGRFR